MHAVARALVLASLGTVACGGDAPQPDSGPEADGAAAARDDGAPRPGNDATSEASAEAGSEAGTTADATSIDPDAAPAVDAGADTPVVDGCDPKTDPCFRCTCDVNANWQCRTNACDGPRCLPGSTFSFPDPPSGNPEKNGGPCANDGEICERGGVRECECTGGRWACRILE